MHGCETIKMMLAKKTETGTVVLCHLLEMIRHNGLEWNANFETVKEIRKYQLPYSYHEIQSPFRSPPSLSLPFQQVKHCTVGLINASSSRRHLSEAMSS